MEWHIFRFRVRKRNHLIQTHTTPHYTTPHHTTPHTQTQFTFSCWLLWGAPTTVHVGIWFPLGFVCLLSCYALLAHQIYFRFKILLVFIDFILILNWLFMISDPIKYSLGQSTDRILTDKLLKKNYRRIPFSLMFFMSRR